MFSLFQEAPALNGLTDTPSDFQPLRKSVAVFDHQPKAMPGVTLEPMQTCPGCVRSHLGSRQSKAAGLGQPASPSVSQHL